MKSRRKQNILTISLVLILVVIANITAVSLALFNKSYNNNIANLLVFGNVDVSAQIKESGSNTYLNAIDLKPTDLMAGNKLYYDLKLNISDKTGVFVRLKANLQIKTNGSSQFVSKTDSSNNSYFSLDVLNKSGSTGESVVGDEDSKTFKKSGNYVYKKLAYEKNSEQIINVRLNISEKIGSVLNSGELLKNSKCRIVLEVESVQEVEGLEAWGYLERVYRLVYEGTTPVLYYGSKKVQTFRSWDVSATAGTDNVHGFLLMDETTLIITGTGAIKDIAFARNITIKDVIITDGITNIGYWAFEDCSSLTSVSLGDSVQSIGNSAFRGCSSLTSIVIPNGVQSIRYSVFNNCTSLTSVSLGDSVQFIGGSAFENCSSLTSILIPDSVQGIYASAFENCTSLTNLIIPDSVQSIYGSAFSGFTSTQTIYIEHKSSSEIANLDSDWLLGCQANIYWYSATQQAGYWHYDSDGVTPVLW